MLTTFQVSFTIVLIGSKNKRILRVKYKFSTQTLTLMRETENVC